MRFKSQVLFLIVFYSLNICAQKETLVFAIDLIRHGDRMPRRDVPGLPHHWPLAFSELTAIGMHQEYELGTQFRQRYIVQQSLLPKNYRAETMTVCSTDFSRTLMSAQSALTGLYPPGTGPDLPNSGSPALPYAFQPVTVRAEPCRDLFDEKKNETMESLLKANPKGTECEKYCNAHVFNQDHWKKKIAKLKPQFVHWQKMTGVDLGNVDTMDTWDQLIFLGEMLHIRELYHVPLPKGLSRADVDTIIHASQWAFVELYKPRSVGDCLSRKLLKKIMKQISLAARKEARFKWILFSAHDTTILSLLSAMGAPTNNAPPYASDLNIALLETRHQHYVVKIQLNNAPVVVPSCGGSTCTLDQFMRLLDLENHEDL